MSWTLTQSATSTQADSCGITIGVGATMRPSTQNNGSGRRSSRVVHDSTIATMSAYGQTSTVAVSVVGIDSGIDSTEQAASKRRDSARIGTPVGCGIDTARPARVFHRISSKTIVDTRSPSLTKDSPT